MRINIEIEISLLEKNVDFTIFKENREEEFYGILTLANYLKPILVFKIYY